MVPLADVPLHEGKTPPDCHNSSRLIPPRRVAQLPSLSGRGHHRMIGQAPVPDLHARRDSHSRQKSHDPSVMADLFRTCSPTTHHHLPHAGVRDRRDEAGSLAAPARPETWDRALTGPSSVARDMSSEVACDAEAKVSRYQNEAVRAAGHVRPLPFQTGTPKSPPMTSSPSCGCHARGSPSALSSTNLKLKPSTTVFCYPLFPSRFSPGGPAALAPGPSRSLPNIREAPTKNRVLIEACFSSDQFGSKEL